MLLAFGKTLGQKIHGWPWGGSRIKPGVVSLKSGKDGAPPERDLSS